VVTTLLPPAWIDQVLVAGKTIVLGQLRPGWLNPLLWRPVFILLHQGRTGALLKYAKCGFGGGELTNTPELQFKVWFLAPFLAIISMLGKHVQVGGQLKFQRRMTRGDQIVVDLTVGRADVAFSAFASPHCDIVRIGHAEID